MLVIRLSFELVLRILPQPMARKLMPSLVITSHAISKPCSKIKVVGDLMDINVY